MSKIYVKFIPFSQFNDADFSLEQNLFHKENQGKIFITDRIKFNSKSEVIIENTLYENIDFGKVKHKYFSCKRFQIVSSPVSLPDELFKF